MKQYLLIELSEIDSRIEYLKKEISFFEENSVKASYDEHESEVLQKLKSKGEIVEKLDDNAITDVFHSTRTTSISKHIENLGLKLIKSNT